MDNNRKFVDILEVSEGDTIIYTGHGGRDENTGEYIANQEFKR